MHYICIIYAYIVYGILLRFHKNVFKLFLFPIGIRFFALFHVDFSRTLLFLYILFYTVLVMFVFIFLAPAAIYEGRHTNTFSLILFTFTLPTSPHPTPPHPRR